MASENATFGVPTCARLCHEIAMRDRIEFGEQVGDLYGHLYDLVFLRTHPLTDVLLSDASVPSKEKGWRLHDLLLDVIKELDPGPSAAPYSREWRRYRLMVGRYLYD